jgi:hypothetical protein
MKTRSIIHRLGLVLRREGVGEKTVLFVSFPGYGQKNLMEKYAKLTPVS